MRRLVDGTASGGRQANRFEGAERRGAVAGIRYTRFERLQGRLAGPVHLLKTTPGRDDSAGENGPEVLGAPLVRRSSWSQRRSRASRGSRLVPSSRLRPKSEIRRK